MNRFPLNVKNENESPNETDSYNSVSLFTIIIFTKRQLQQQFVNFDTILPPFLGISLHYTPKQIGSRSLLPNDKPIYHNTMCNHQAIHKDCTFSPPAYKPNRHLSHIGEGHSETISFYRGCPVCKSGGECIFHR